MKDLTGRLRERVKAWIMRHTWEDVRTDFIVTPSATPDPPSHREREPISYATYFARQIQGRR